MATLERRDDETLREYVERLRVERLRELQTILDNHVAPGFAGHGSHRPGRVCLECERVNRTL